MSRFQGSGLRKSPVAVQEGEPFSEAIPRLLLHARFMMNLESLSRQREGSNKDDAANSVRLICFAT